MRIRIQSVPLWPVIFALFLMLGAVLTCREQVATAVNDASRWTSADGRPMDNAGNRIKCPNCSDRGELGVLVKQDGYWYRCERCGRSMQARYHSASGRIEFMGRNMR